MRPLDEPDLVTTLFVGKCDDHLRIMHLRDALRRIAMKGDGTWSADRCAVEAKAALRR